MHNNQSKSTINLTLQNHESYLVGGDLIEGYIAIDVKEENFVLQRLYLQRSCNVYLKAINSRSEETMILPANIRAKVRNFYSERNDLITSPTTLPIGIHKYRFSASLPMECPPSIDYPRDKVYHQVLVYGNFTFHNGLNIENFWDRIFYNYYPVHYISDFDHKTPLSSSINLKTYFDRKIKLERFIPRKQRFDSTPTPSSVVDVTFRFPRNGIRQDKKNYFGISVRCAHVDSSEFQISELSISLLCTAIEKFSNIRYSNRVGRVELVKKILYAPAKEVEIADIEVSNEQDQIHTPSFISPSLSFRNDLVLSLILTREFNGKPEVAKLERNILYTVLSPEVRQDQKDCKTSGYQEHPPQPVAARPRRLSSVATQISEQEGSERVTPAHSLNRPDNPPSYSELPQAKYI